MNRAEATDRFQYFEILKAEALRAGLSERAADELAIEHMADLHKVGMEKIRSFLQKCRGLRLSGYIPSRTWKDFLSNEAVATALQREEKTSSADLYAAFENFWLRRNRDADFAPSRKIFGRCLSLAGFQRVKVRSKWFWTGIILKDKECRQ